MRETKTLDMDSISKEENRSEEKGIQDVEEGEISDAASVEEISEGDFKKQETKIVKESNSSTNSKLTKPESRVWTMSDLFKYQMKGGYVSGLSNLAWAQAVQNKPLTEIFAETEAKRPDLLDASGKDGGVVDGDGGELADGEKEEGELEEGEIDLDTNTVGKLNGEDKIDSNALATNSNSNAAAKNLNLIRGVLESVNGVEVEQSFETICTNVGDAIGRLRELVRENSTLNLNNDGVSRSLYIVVQRIILAYGCMSDDLKKQKKEIFSRFTGTMNNIGPHIFSPEQAKGIEVMISSVDFPDSLVNAKDQENKPGDNLLSTDVEYNKSCISSETPKVGVPSCRSRANLLRPLIDLHKDHDEDSLPSPTRETTTTFPVHRVLMAGEGANPGFPTPKPVPSVQDPRTQFYANDALKAVSSYQQKFGRNSFFMTDRLPSPTPSEESGDGEGDTGGEVSSSSTINNLKSVNPSFTIQPVVSPPVVPESQSLPAITPVNPPVSAGPAVSRPAVKSSAKSRDPRLRYVNSDVNRMDQSQHSLPIVNSVPFGQINNPKKQKNAEDTSIDGPAMKKQRNSLENVGGLREGIAVTRSGLLLEDIDMVGPQIKNSNQAKMDSDPRNLQNGDTGRVLSISQERIPVTGTNTTTKVEQVALTGTGPTSIPDLLKVLAVNPALLNNPALMNNSVLLNILKMGQQSLALDTLPKTADSATINGQLPSVNPVIGSGPMLNVVASLSQGILPKAAPPQFPSQVSASDERGKIRMKPRDPRRALHNTAIQRNGTLGSDQLKANINPTSADQGIKENQIVQKQEGQTETKQALKSVTESEITSAAQVSAAPSTTQNTTVSVSLNSDRESGTCTSVDVTAAAARSPNGWADVEHLFQNYDDQQKAAIQRERARRMDEQKKMFAQRKLCLVLDLDHTLLNSAKFVEVDPVHDEILRKKEEQDREKLFRHLFRFPHMGMWTKLRPGIWNFLEKASQLYELHLYTMGNKLYATEMAKLLDPKGTLFAGRVISRGDDGDTLDSDDRVPKSKDLEGVLGMESSVVIMDDSVRVWPHNKLNLIVVERYIYFPCSRRQFGLPGPSLLEIDHDERPEDGTLASSLAVIQKIHQNFFTHPSLDEADVRSILATEQRKILDGCRIVFSRVFPVDEVKPHLHPLWLTAEQFGAVCTNQIDDQVTHVVANSLGTDKVNWALSKGRHVVYPGWVEASALLYRRANERDFAVK